MSLATDILNSLNKAAPPKPAKKPRAPRDTRKPAAPKHARTKPPEPRKFGRTRAPAAAAAIRPVEHVPGVSFITKSGGWDAYFYDGTKKVVIGLFPTQARAIIARKIYMLWRKRGFTDIPNKPSRRLYTNW